MCSLQAKPIVVNKKDGLQVLQVTLWLIPRWAETGKPGMQFPAFNAHCESIDTSKLFALSFKAYRCLRCYWQERNISAKEL